MRKRSSEQVFQFNKMDSIISGGSSHRESSVKECTVQEEEEGNFHRQNQLKNIRQRIFIKKVIKQLESLISLNRSPGQINEEWQGKQQNEETKTIVTMQSLEQKMTKIYPWMKICPIVQGISLLIFLWCVSVSIVFQQNLFSLCFTIIASMQFVIMVAKAVIININQELGQMDYCTKFKKFVVPFLIFFCSSLMLVRNNLDLGSFKIPVDTFMILVFLWLSTQASFFFKPIKVFAENRKIIKELRIIELFCVLLVVAHIFGLIIYSSIYLQPAGEQNWLNSNGRTLQYRPWHTRYIYAVYWAITAIVTVGFGDLTPQNEAEVIVIMILEIFGTSFFGYMINVIGITVDNINKKNEEYDNYQQTISKLKDHYQLSDQLCQSMKKDIQNKYNKEHKTVSLKKNEEMNFLEYVDSTVKKNFILETNIRIIKKSIFFLTYFTVNFQNYVALKLIRCIYKKDENIETYDPITKQRNIIIVNHGKVNLYIEKRQNNIIKNKLVRTIEPIEGQTALNVIGYSSLILNQNIDIFSIASEMTSGYILRMSDVLECIDKSMIDYESFHEMRQKMLIFSLKQAIEAPSLKDSNFHYTPNIFILTCKYNKNSLQKRNKILRKKKRGFLILDKVKTHLAKDWYTVNQQQSELYSDEAEGSGKLSKKIEDFESLLSVEDAEDQMLLTNHVIHNRLQEKHLNVDQVKIFQHFMKNHNINFLAANYQKACIQKSYKGRIQSIHVKKTNRPKSSSKELQRKLQLSIRMSKQFPPIRL